MSENELIEAAGPTAVDMDDSARGRRPRASPAPSHRPALST